MDSPRDRHTEQDMQDEPPQKSEAAIRAMLEESRQDIAEGRTVPLAPVLERMQKTAERVRQEREASIGVGRRLG